MTLVLPYPPTVNHYYRAGARGARFLTARALAYRDAVAAIVYVERANRSLTSRLGVDVLVHCPDRRERDLDNLAKSLLDALQHAAVYRRDSQIDRLCFERGPVQRGGAVRVTITKREEITE